ncbi:MAG: hypothetical protein ACOC80_06660 [Petrotogales bacterium]
MKIKIQNGMVSVTYDSGTFVIKVYNSKERWIQSYQRKFDQANIEIDEFGILHFKAQYRISRRYDHIWSDNRKDFDLTIIERIECQPDDYELKKTFWLKKPYLFFKSKAYLLKKTYGIEEIITPNFRIEKD